MRRRKQSKAERKQSKAKTLTDMLKTLDKQQRKRKNDK